MTRDDHVMFMYFDVCFIVSPSFPQNNQPLRSIWRTWSSLWRCVPLYTFFVLLFHSPFFLLQNQNILKYTTWCYEWLLFVPLEWSFFRILMSFSSLFYDWLSLSLSLSLLTLRSRRVIWFVLPFSLFVEWGRFVLVGSHDTSWYIFG